MKKKTIAVISNDSVWTYNLRREVIEALLDDGYRVVIFVGYGQRIDDLKAMGCEIIDIPVDRHGMNPVREFSLLTKYFKALKDLKPELVLTYTIKPNIYGGLACQAQRIPYVANITGLGTMIENKSAFQKMAIFLLKLGLRKASMVFFQNTENMKFLLEKKVVSGRYELLPGSGVNLSHFKALTYPSDDVVNFVFISRIMKEKGIDQYLEAATVIRDRHPNTKFHICGFCEQNYKAQISELCRAGVVIYHGMVDDVREVLEKMHCTVHPTYYPEGLSNVLLESSACARPIITTNRSGCREVIEDNANGYIVREKDGQDLIEKLEAFLSLSYEQKRSMGIYGREKVEREFDREIVVSHYERITAELLNKTEE